MFSFGLVSSSPFWVSEPLLLAGLCKFPQGLSCSCSIDSFICCQHKILLVLLWATLGRGEAQTLRNWGPWLFSSMTSCKAIGLSSNDWLNNLSEGLPHRVLRKHLWAWTEILNFGKFYCFVLLLQIFKNNKALCIPNQSPNEFTLLISSLGPLTDLPGLGILDPTEVILTFSCKVGLFKMLLKRPESKSSENDPHSLLDKCLLRHFWRCPSFRRTWRSG